MIILNKSVVTYCQIQHQDSSVAELGVSWGDQPYAMCAAFPLAEEQQALFYAKTCGRPALIVHSDDSYLVWCQLTNLVIYTDPAFVFRPSLTAVAS